MPLKMLETKLEAPFFLVEKRRVKKLDFDALAAKMNKNKWVTSLFYLCYFLCCGKFAVDRLTLAGSWFFENHWKRFIRIKV